MMSFDNLLAVNQHSVQNEQQNSCMAIILSPNQGDRLDANSQLEGHVNSLAISILGVHLSQLPPSICNMVKSSFNALDQLFCAIPEGKTMRKVMMKQMEILLKKDISDKLMLTGANTPSELLEKMKKTTQIKAEAEKLFYADSSNCSLMFAADMAMAQAAFGLLTNEEDVVKIYWKKITQLSNGYAEMHEKVENRLLSFVSDISLIANNFNAYSISSKALQTSPMDTFSSVTYCFQFIKNLRKNMQQKFTQLHAEATSAHSSNDSIMLKYLCLQYTLFVPAITNYFIRRILHPIIQEKEAFIEWERSRIPEIQKGFIKNEKERQIRVLQKIEEARKIFSTTEFVEVEQYLQKEYQDSVKYIASLEEEIINIDADLLKSGEGQELLALQKLMPLETEYKKAITRMFKADQGQGFSFGSLPESQVSVESIIQKKQQEAIARRQLFEEVGNKIVLL